LVLGSRVRQQPLARSRCASIAQGGRSAETNAVFILQPSLYRVMEQVKQVSPKKFGGYRLSYDGGVGTSTFVGELRYAAAARHRHHRHSIVPRWD